MNGFSYVVGSRSSWLRRVGLRGAQRSRLAARLDHMLSLEKLNGGLGRARGVRFGDLVVRCLDSVPISIWGLNAFIPGFARAYCVPILTARL